MYLSDPRQKYRTRSHLALEKALAHSTGELNSEVLSFQLKFCVCRPDAQHPKLSDLLVCYKDSVEQLLIQLPLSLRQNARHSYLQLSLIHI